MISNYEFDKQIRILIGCPTSYHKKYCLNEYVEGIKKLNKINIYTDILIVDNSERDDYLNEIKKSGLPAIKGPYFSGAKDRIVSSRNILRKKVIEGNYDYFLSLEQDVVPDPDVLQKLLACGKKIVSAVVTGMQNVNGNVIPAPMLYMQSKLNPETIWFLEPAEIDKPQLIEVHDCALGCVLIHRDVLEKIEFRYIGGFDDMIFCKDSREKGYPIYCNTTARTTHLQKEYWHTVKK